MVDARVKHGLTAGSSVRCLHQLVKEDETLMIYCRPLHRSLPPLDTNKHLVWLTAQAFDNKQHWPRSWVIPHALGQ